jgi:hypothetical protein
MLRKIMILIFMPMLCSLLYAGDVNPLVLKACRQTCDKFLDEMSKSLHDAILEKGLTGAVGVCADNVEALCKKFSERPGLTVERITLLKLKEQNRLKQFEAKALKELIDSPASSAKGKDERYEWTTTKGGGHQLAYLRAVRVEPLCLTCHGPASMVPNDVKTVLHEKYNALPSENKIGDVKGAMLVILELPAAEPILKEMQTSEEK